MSETTSRPGRIDILDVARGIALLAMATYHFSWDLEFFGYLDPGTSAHGPLKLYARCIASTFLMLVGISLVLAHGNGIRWPSFWKRFAMVAIAAVAITIGTYFAFPDGLIFFGILHEIAVGSLLGLAFLRLPPILTLVIAAVVVALPNLWTHEAFNSPWLWWIGLSPSNPRSNDFVPIFPWFGAVLVGIAIARLTSRFGLWERLARIRAGSWAQPFRFAGRHSLAFYLIHQPVLLACLWVLSQFHPGAGASEQARFTRSCEKQCIETQDQAFCTAYCGCMLQKIESENLLGALFSRSVPESLNRKLEDFALMCSEAPTGTEEDSP